MHDKRRPGSFGPFNTVSELLRMLLGGRVSSDETLETLGSANRSTNKRYVTSTDDNGLVIDIDLPGIAPRDVTLWVTRTVVIVKHPTRGGSGVATQRYTVSGDYDLSTAEASMADGRLRVRIAKAMTIEPRRIVIEYANRSAG